MDAELEFLCIHMVPVSSVEETATNQPLSALLNNNRDNRPNPSSHSHHPLLPMEAYGKDQTVGMASLVVLIRMTGISTRSLSSTIRRGNIPVSDNAVKIAQALPYLNLEQQQALPTVIKAMGIPLHDQE